MILVWYKTILYDIIVLQMISSEMDHMGYIMGYIRCDMPNIRSYNFEWYHSVLYDIKNMIKHFIIAMIS
jgi:hypothetical protein